MRVVVALGGNALLRRGEQPDAAIQLEHVERAAPALVKVAAEHQMVLVHGNGPQVGMLALESEADHTLSRPYPFSDLVAETQGLIGYWLQQALVNAGLTTPVITLVTQTVVAADDPAFAVPTKFVGTTYEEERARALARANDWTIGQDGDGWRRVVASPLPVRIVEIETARTLVHSGSTVVIGGGGGVPVVERSGGLHGVDAIVDKDHVAALVATELRADLLVILTDVEGVMTDYGTDRQQTVRNVSATNLRAMTFPTGSMGPKATAACDFVQATGGRAAIGSLAAAGDVITGSAGTHVHG